MKNERDRLGRLYQDERHHVARGRGQAAPAMAETEVDGSGEPQRGNGFGFGVGNGQGGGERSTVDGTKQDAVRAVRNRGRWI
jgi:hypothetical protein